MGAKLIRSGDGWAIAVDEETLARAGIGDDTPLVAHVEGKRLVIEVAENGASRDPFEQLPPDLRASYQRVLKEHDGVFRRLAE